MIATARVRTVEAARWFFSETAQGIVRYWLGGGSIVIGLSWIFGPNARHSSAIYATWNDLGVSWQLTGLWALLSGLLIVLPLPWPQLRIVGYAMGFLFRFTFAGYALGAFFTNTQTGLTGFTDWSMLAVLHVVVLFAVLKGREIPTDQDIEEAAERRTRA